MSVCPVCYRENEPVAGRCPSCGAARTPGIRATSDVEDEPTNYNRPRGSGVTSRPMSAAPALSEDEATRPRAQMPTAGTPRMILKGAAGDGTEFPLGENNILGRSTTASVRLADREVSRKHSQVDKEGEDYVLRDLGSSNGTFL